MASWNRLLALLVAASMTLSSGAVAAADDPSEATGFVFIQIDGLSAPALLAALDAGHVPFMHGLLQEGSHTLGRWHTTAASTTVVTQAGLLHGRWRGLPGFRWWDRDRAAFIDFGHVEESRRLVERIGGAGDLLADGGASITNLYSGGAPRVVFTASDFDGPAHEAVRFLADVPRLAAVGVGFGQGLGAALRRVARGEAAPLISGIDRKASFPVVGPAVQWAIADLVTASVVKEMDRGTPIIYATMTTFDEVSHYAGLHHPATSEALTNIDRGLAHVASRAEQAPRSYRLVILSDHGNTAGMAFALAYGETLEAVVQGLLSSSTQEDGSAGQARPIVAASGNLAHIYLAPTGPRWDLEASRARHPRLVAGLAAHPGVGVVVAQTEGGGLLALGADGSHDLVSGHVEGLDPLSVYGPFAAESMRNIAGSPDAGDLVVISTYDPLADEVHSFEGQLGSHGGIGGPQTEPFLLYPSDLEPGNETLSLVGIDALRAKFDEWIAGAAAGAEMPADRVPSSAAESRPDLVGEPACVTAEVRGASGEVCGRRDRFGATWSLRLSDTLEDGRPVHATVGLEVEEAPDETERLDHDEGDGSTVDAAGTFRPRTGLAIGDLTLRTCVARRFLPDRCRSSSVALPQIEGRGTEAQLARLEELLFELPLERFMAEWEQDQHPGIDAEFDWSGNGCSAGPLAGLFDERLRAACLRHDFAYRNLGVLGFDPRDTTRTRVDELLAADAVALGQDALAPALRRSLQQFGGPAFYGQDLAALWEAPEFLVPLLRTEEAATPTTRD
jgi:hypothetical protein